MSETCIFCKIVKKTSPAKIKLENDEMLIFEDIKPVARHHYLSIPKEHIQNVKQLNTPDHRGLLERLISESKKVVQEQGGDLSDLRLGFHLPPFNTVGHLHMHAICPASNLSLLHCVMFRPGSYWFASAEEIQEKLQKLEDDGNCTVANKL